MEVKLCIRQKMGELVGNNMNRDNMNRDKLNLAFISYTKQQLDIIRNIFYNYDMGFHNSFLLLQEECLCIVGSAVSKLKMIVGTANIAEKS